MPCIDNGRPRAPLLSVNIDIANVGVSVSVFGALEGRGNANVRTPHKQSLSWFRLLSNVFFRNCDLTAADYLHKCTVHNSTTLAQFLFHWHSVSVRGISSGLATRASLGIRQSCDFSSTDTYLTNQRVHRGDFHGMQGARDPGV